MSFLSDSHNAAILRAVLQPMMNVERQSS